MITIMPPVSNLGAHGSLLTVSLSKTLALSRSRAGIWYFSLQSSGFLLYQRNRPGKVVVPRFLTYTSLHGFLRSHSSLLCLRPLSLLFSSAPTSSLGPHSFILPPLTASHLVDSALCIRSVMEISYWVLAFWIFLCLFASGSSSIENFRQAWVALGCCYLFEFESWLMSLSGFIMNFTFDCCVK